MNLFTPVSDTFKTNLSDFNANKYYKFLVDVNIDGNYVDLTSKIYNNTIEGTYSEQKATNWKITLRNSDKTYTDGSLAKCPCIIQAKCGDSDYFTIFTGQISNEGADRTITYLNDDVIVLNAYDAIKTKGVTKKSGPYTVVGYNICNTNASGSLFHLLASDMGFSASKCDVYATLPNVKDYLTLEQRTTTWKELQLLREAFLGMMYIRYDGKLRFASPFMTDWPGQTSEWTFDASNIWNIKPSHDLVSANYVTTEFDQYISFDSRVIHKNTQLWNLLYEYNEIPILPGQYWPGGTEKDVASLKFKDPKSGEEWPICISIQTPTIGSYSDTATEDILCSNGLLTLYSFNGLYGTDPSLTQREPNAAQIILKNNTAGTVYIRKLEIRGVPLRIEAQKKIEVTDPNISVDERIQKDIKGRYVTSDTQGYQACKYYYDYGSLNRSTLQLQTHWLPQAQLGAVVDVSLSADEYGPDGLTKNYYIVGIKHPAPNGPNTKLNTQLILQEYLDYTATGAPSGGTQIYSGNAAPEVLDTVPTFNDLQSGYDTGGGTTTPAQVTISECRAVGIRAIQLQWDRQVNLTNFDHYEIQVSDDGSTWYSLKMDGTDWKDALGDYTEWPNEFLVHAGIPFGGTVDNPSGKQLYYRVRRATKDGTKGTWSSTSNATTRTVNPGELAANSVYANNFVAGVIDTLLLYVDTALYIGFQGSGSTSNPSDGDRRIYIDEDELLFQVYINGGWSNVRNIKIGGIVAGIFAALVACQGLYHPENPPTSLEYLPKNGVLLYNFEGDFNDQFGIESFDVTYQATQVSTVSKFGTYSFFPDTGYDMAYVSYGVFGVSASQYLIGKSLTYGVYYYFTELADTEANLFYCFDFLLGGDTIYVTIDSTNVRLKITKGVSGSEEVITIAHGFTLSTWNYIGFIYDEDTDTAYLIVNDSIDSTDSIAGTWHDTRYWVMGLYTYNHRNFSGTYITAYADELLFSPSIFSSPDILSLHYLSGLNWNSDYSQADIFLRPNDTGRIIFDDNQNEKSLGTLHIIDADDRPSTDVLNGGASTSPTTVDFSAYVPYGVKALLLSARLYFNTGTSNYLNVRKKGVSSTLETQLSSIYCYSSSSSLDLAIKGMLICDCTVNGEIEYKISSSGGLGYLNIIGYWI